MQKVLISGSRQGVNRTFVMAALKSIISEISPLPIILHGGAIGADQIAREYANHNNLKEIILLPDYQRYSSRLAPILRNTDLVKQADICIIIWGLDRIGKGGTNDTYKKAKNKGIEIIEILPSGTIKRQDQQAKIF